MTDVTLPGADAPGAEHHPPLAIDFLYWEECPSHERALALLRDVLREENAAADLRLQRIDTEDEARSWSFPGSPTIRVNGTDIDNNPALPVGLACRAYRRDDGRISPLPPRSLLVRAIRRATPEHPDVQTSIRCTGAGEAAS
jgi:hypothetical protein